MTSELINSGYSVNQKHFRPNDNWFGVSVYNPDVKLTKGDYTVLMSLNGLLIPDITLNKSNKIVINKRNGEKEQTDITATQGKPTNIPFKYILIKHGDIVLYEDCWGNVPPNEIMDLITK